MTNLSKRLEKMKLLESKLTNEMHLIIFMIGIFAHVYLLFSGKTWEAVVVLFLLLGYVLLMEGYKRGIHQFTMKLGTAEISARLNEAADNMKELEKVTVQALPESKKQDFEQQVQTTIGTINAAKKTLDVFVSSANVSEGKYFADLLIDTYMKQTPERNIRPADFTNEKIERSGK
jgi:hypothetical protein